MRYLSKCNHDAFLPGQTFYSSRKLHSRSVDYKQMASTNGFKVGSRSIIITKIKKQPPSFSSHVSKISIKDELMKAIMGIQPTKKEETYNKINSMRLQKMRSNSNSNQAKTTRRQHMTLQDLRQNSFDIIPVVLMKRPSSKRSGQYKSTRPVSSAKQTIPVKPIQLIPKPLQIDRKQNIQKRKRDANEKKLANKTIRFMGQQISPW